SLTTIVNNPHVGNLAVQRGSGGGPCLVAAQFKPHNDLAGVGRFRTDILGINTRNCAGGGSVNVAGGTDRDQPVAQLKVAGQVGVKAQALDATSRGDDGASQCNQARCQAITHQAPKQPA